MFLGWSSRTYPLDADDFASVPDYSGPPIPAEDLPDDEVVLLMGKGREDCLVRGREAVRAAKGGTVDVRIAFVPSVSKWNLPAALVSVLKSRFRYKGTGTYHISADAVRRMCLERAIRTLSSPQERDGIDRNAKMQKLEASLRERGYDDAKPIVVMLCRSRGCEDSLRQGHHRVSACIACGVRKMAIRFSAAGALPRGLRRFVRLPPLRLEVLRHSLGNALGFPLRRLVHVHKGNSALNLVAEKEDGTRFFAKLVRDREKAERLARIYNTLDTPLVPKLLFGKRPVAVGRHYLLAFEYVPGRAIPPERMTDEQVADFAAKYREMQEALSAAFGRSMVHGDLNSDNFFWRGGRVACFFDFEQARPGVPAEDLARLFVWRAEHKRWHGPLFRLRLESVFCKLVDALPYPREDYRRALDEYRDRKADRLSRKRRFSPLLPFKLNRQARIFQSLAASLSLAPRFAPAVVVPLLVGAAVVLDVAVMKTAFGDHSIVAWTQFACVTLSALAMFVLMGMERDARAGYAALAGVFVAMAAYEFMRDAQVVASKGASVAAMCAALLAGAAWAATRPRQFAAGLRNICASRSFQALPFAFVTILGLAKIASARALWSALSLSESELRGVRRIAEESTELLGYASLLCWAVSFFVERLAAWREER